MIMVCTALAHRHTHHKVVESTKEHKNTNPASSATIKMCKQKQKGRFSQGCFLSKAIICLNVIRQNRPYTRNQHFLNTHVLKTLFKNFECCFCRLFIPKAFWIVGWWYPAGNHIFSKKNLVILIFQTFGWSPPGVPRLAILLPLSALLLSSFAYPLHSTPSQASNTHINHT